MTSMLRQLRWISPWLLLLFVAVPQRAHAQQRDASVVLRRLEQLKDGWNRLVPGGETSCVTDANYHFFARRGDPERLLVYFQGGGACWNGETCARGEPVYKPDLRNDPERPQEGILDLRDPENPFAGFSMVFVSFCTGDVHLGHADTTYSVRDESGATRQLAIRHRGHVNAQAVLEWVYANFRAPREVFVAGTSAGAVAAPFYGSLLANRYPRARVVALSDDAGTLQRDAIARVESGRWRFLQVVRAQAGWQHFPEKWGIEDLFVAAARAAPSLRLYQVDHADDNAQRRYHVLAGSPDSDLPALLRANRRTIQQQVPTFRAYTIGGSRHRVLSERMFYAYATNGHRFRDWVAALATADTVPSVDCGTCTRPELIHTNADLAIIDRARELLSTPGAWHAKDVTPCAGLPAGRYTLRCAVREAIIHVTGTPPSLPHGIPSGPEEVLYSAAERLGDPTMRQGDPVKAYNERPGATAQDMVALLEDVRERIRSRMKR